MPVPRLKEYFNSNEIEEMEWTFEDTFKDSIIVKLSKMKGIYDTRLFMETDFFTQYGKKTSFPIGTIVFYSIAKNDPYAIVLNSRHGYFDKGDILFFYNGSIEKVIISWERKIKNIECAIYTNDEDGVNVFFHDNGNLKKINIGLNSKKDTKFKFNIEPFTDIVFYNNGEIESCIIAEEYFCEICGVLFKKGKIEFYEKTLPQ